MLRMIVDQFAVFWAQAVAIVPRIAAAMLVLLTGWIAADVLRRVTVRTLRMVKADVLAERSGVEGFLIQGGVRFTAVSLVAWAIYWLLLLTAFGLALSVAGLDMGDDMMRRTLSYIPKVLVAVLTVIVGAFFARIVGGAIGTYLGNVGVEGSRAIGLTAQYAIVIFVATVALEQLEIGGETLTAAFKMAFGGVCLAFGLAFGLGGRRWAAAVLERIWKP